MRNRIIALLLVLTMALSLAACGKSAPADSSAPDTPVEKTYTSDQAMDVFETIETVRELKDFTFDLQINAVDSETGEATKTMAVLTGECYASSKQAAFTATMPNGEVFTDVVVDGNLCYVDIVAAAKYLAGAFERMDDADGEFFRDELTELAKEFPTNYVTFQLKEDPWTTLEGEAFAGVKQLLADVYESIKKDTAAKVKTDSSTCTLSLGLGDLQKEWLKVTGSLTEEKAAYQEFLIGYIEDNFSDLLNASGWTMTDLMDTVWSEYEISYEDMSALEANGAWNNWTMKMVTCGDEADGYTLDFTKCDNKPVNYFLQAYPAEAQAIAVPEESTYYAESSEMAGNVFGVYMDALTYRNLSAIEDDDLSEYAEEAELDDNGASVSDEIDTTPIEGYKRILATDMVTNDGKSVAVPVLAKYDSLEVQNIGTGVNDILQQTTGYDLEFSNINVSGRTPEEIVQQNVEIYADTFQNDYGYEITQDASSVVAAEDQSAYVAGMSYNDSDYGYEITVITGVIPVEGSDNAIAFDIIVRSKPVTKNEVNSIQDFLTYLGLECPVTIIKK